jgi:hypothetical protein
MLRKILFEYKTDEVKEKFELYNEGPRDIFRKIHIVRKVKSTFLLRLAGHVSRLRETRNKYRIFVWNYLCKVSI